MTSPENSSVNVLHPLQIPELVNTICSLLDIKSCVKLLFLSRRVYAIVLPIVWKDAEMESLFRLIPGTKVEDHDTSHPTGCNYAIHFPATRDLTRFTIHAPFVKTLRASRPYAVNFPSRWPSSGPDAASNPLLPNLQRLVITTFDTIIAAWSVDWIPRLLYPGLLGLEMFTVQPSGDESESYAWLDKNTYFNLASQVSRACPRIETLRLFPEDIVLLPKKDAIKIYNQIADFRYLRSLAFSGTVVHEKLLEVLGRLPHLETLSLCSDFADNKEFDEIPLSVPNDSFPSLRHLYLYALYETTMSSVCKIPPLFSRPVKTIILFEDQYSDDDMGDDERSDVAVTCLGRNSPQLQELTILPRGNNGLFIITRPILDTLKCMPLRYLRLGERG
ncbi:hypothetical protein FRC12_016363 [Ceratobasidium sp. 428]|nr:hypothetical protein FRC12_016363 [Ceratobasidium sp. 428]